jgi:hypothetical protein
MSELASYVKTETKNNSMQCEHKCPELKQHPMSVNRQELHLPTVVDWLFN